MKEATNGGMPKALTAQNAEHANELIARLVQECAEGKSDREGEARLLAELWCLDAEAVKRDFAEARTVHPNSIRHSEELVTRGREIAKAQQARKGEAKPDEAKPAPKAKLDLWIELKAEPEPEPKAEPKLKDVEGPLRETEAALKASGEVEEEPKAEKGQLPAVVPQAPLVPLDDALVAMNSRHAILENVGGKTVIGCWEQFDDGYFRLAYHGKDSFLLRYSNATITVDAPDGRGGLRPSTMDLAKWWLDHRNRAQYRGVKFRPNGQGVVNGYLNLWRGWGIEPKPGDWSLIQRHITEVIAGGNAEFAEYVLRWIAWAIQNPDKQAEVALVLIGEKGTGKGTLGRCLERIFGSHALQVTDREQVIGRFNGHLEDCILFIADEAYWGGDKRCVGKLQGMITERNLPIERKGFDMYPAKNFLHVLMLAEPGWLFPPDDLSAAMPHSRSVRCGVETKLTSKPSIAR